MRTFDQLFTEELAKPSARPFWSLRIRFSEAPRWQISVAEEEPGDVYLSTFVNWPGISGYEPALLGLSEISSRIDARDTKNVLDLPSSDASFCNMPAAMSSGRRLSEYFTQTLQLTDVDVNLNLALAGGSIITATLFQAICRTPNPRGYKVGSLHLLSKSEKRLNAPVLNTISDLDCPGARRSDVGKTIPIAIGTVPSSPGRVVKSGFASLPVAGTKNKGSAQLARIHTLPPPTLSSWLFTVLPDEVVEFDSSDATSEVGKREASAATVGFDAAYHAEGDVGSNFIRRTGMTIADHPKIVAIVTVHTNGAGVKEIISAPSGSNLAEMKAASGAIVPTLVKSAVLQGAGGSHPSVGTYVYKVANPAPGNFNVEAVATTNTALLRLEVVVLYNVDASAAIVALAKTDPANSLMNNGASGQAAAFDGCLALDFVGWMPAYLPQVGPFQPPPEATAGSGETTNSNEPGPGAPGFLGGASARRVAGGSTVKMKWTFDRVSAISYVSLVIAPADPYDYDQYSQGFETTATRELAGVELHVGKNPAWMPPAGDPHGSPKMTVQCRAGTVSAPGVVLGEAVINVPSTTRQYLTVALPLTVPAATPRHWVVRSDCDAAGNGGVLWSRKSTGGYAGGQANHGGVNEDSWSNDMASQDFAFKVVFGDALTFSATNETTGHANGTGTVGEDFTPTLEPYFLVRGADWSGTPVPGDTFRFSIDAVGAKVIFSESTADVPCRGFGTIRWAGKAIGQGNSPLDGSVNATPGDGSIVQVGNATNTRVGRRIQVTAPTPVAYVQMTLGFNGSPSRPITIALRNETGTDPGETVYISRTIDSAVLIAAAGSGPVGFFAVPDELVVLDPGFYWLVAETEQSNASHYYKVASKAAGSGLVRVKDATTWTAQSGDLAVALLATPPVVDLLMAPFAAHPARTVLGFTIFADIPDSADITADVLGIRDNDVGRYTNVPEAPIRSLTSVVRFLLERAGVSPLEMDLAAGGTFQRTAAALGPSALHDGLVQDETDYKALVMRLCFEMGCVFDWSGSLAQVKYLAVPSLYTSAVRTITYADLLARDGEPDISIEDIGLEEVVNFATARWGRRANESGDSAYDHSRDFDDSGLQNSVAIYGKLDRPGGYFNFDFVQVDAVVADVVGRYLQRNAAGGKRAVAGLPRWFYDLEKNDVVALDLRNPAAGNEAFEGYDGTQFLEIEREAKIPKDITARLMLRSLPPPLGLLFTADFDEETEVATRLAFTADFEEVGDAPDPDTLAYTYAGGG